MWDFWHLYKRAFNKEQTLNIKQFLSLPELDSSKASEGWLDKWKLSYSIKEK